MNSSLIGADKATHAKIVGTSLVTMLLLLAVGFWAHSTNDANSGKPAVVNASTPTTYTSHDGAVVRR
jgi:hypothetical protein